MKQVVIIGGGLAGCASAEAFSRRGWQVRVLEARDRLGGAVAGLPLIAQHPGLTPDFDLRSRLLVQAMQLHGRLRAGPAADLAPAFEVCGRLQPMERARAERCVAPVDRAVAQVAESPQGAWGVWFPDCAAVSPRRWWQAVLQRPGLSVHTGITVGRVDATATGWRVVDDQGNRVANADVVVLACREQALTLAGMQEADHGRLRLSAARCGWRGPMAARPMRTPATLPCCP
ncbi:FAD-dependent oxidoreductase [Lautropia mirabilis]